MRRWSYAVVPLVLVAAWAAGAPLLSAAPAPPSPAERPGPAVTLTVADVERAAEFYERVLFFERAGVLERWGGDAPARVVRMRLGRETLDLVQDRTARHSRQPVVIVVSDLDQAYLWLRRQHVATASPAPRPDWDPETGDTRVVRFSDPEGHPLALVQFPAGKGAARWRRPSDRVFLGIDAVTVIAPHDAP